MGVGDNDVPKNSPLTLMKYKCFLAGYQKPAKLVKIIINNKNSQKHKKGPQNVELMSKPICILCCS